MATRRGLIRGRRMGSSLAAAALLRGRSETCSGIRACSFREGSPPQRLTFLVIAGLALLLAAVPKTTCAAPIHALDIVSNVNNNSGYSVGWDFQVSGTIWVTNLGIFDPSGTANGEVAIYQDFTGGNRLADGNVLTSSPTEMSGSVSARYVSLATPVQLTSGTYVIYTNANETFSEHTTAVTFGPAISKGPLGGVANGGTGGALSTTTPAFGITNNVDYRYYGPTFEYVTVNPTVTSWNLTGGGTWNNAANWSQGTVPQNAGDNANFGSSITAPSTVTVDSAVTVGTISFSNSTQTYTIGGSQGVTMQSTSGNATIQDLAGSHTISTPITMASNTDVTVSALGDVLTIGNIGDGGANNGLNKLGAGTLTTSGTSTYGGATAVNAGTLLVNSPGSLLSTVTVNSAVLGGNGTVGGIVLNSSGQLAPGPDINTVSTLTTGSLSISPSSVIDFKFNGSTNDLINVTSPSSLAISGGGLELYASGGTSAFDTFGTYRLFQYTGTDPAFANLSVLNKVAGVRYGFGKSTDTGTGNTFIAPDYRQRPDLEWSQCGQLVVGRFRELVGRRHPDGRHAHVRRQHALAEQQRSDGGDGVPQPCFRGHGRQRGDGFHNRRRPRHHPHWRPEQQPDPQ